MTEIARRLSTTWQDGINVLLGLWLIASPWMLGFMDARAASWNSWIAGSIVTVAALAALLTFHSWEEWVNMALGVWLIVSPWVLGFSHLQNALWNAIVVGLLVGLMAFWSYIRDHDSGGLLSQS